MMPFYFGTDPTYILAITGIAISDAAPTYVNSALRRYDQVRSSKHVTGTQAAQYILRKEQTDDAGVQQIASDLTDNYNSGSKMLSLSEATAQPTSVVTISVVAHERGHAIRDHMNYVLLRLRAVIVPAANVGSTTSFPLILLGALFSRNQTLINTGILAFSLTSAFQLVTLPVEFSVSRRALGILSGGGLLVEEEVPMVRRVFFAAVLAHVAVAFSAFL